MNEANITFSDLTLNSVGQCFVSFPEDPDAADSSKTTSVRISSALAEVLRAEHGEEFCATYARDRRGQPYLAVATEPEAVEQTVASVSFYESGAGINSTHLVRILARHWGEEAPIPRGKCRLYWTFETETVDPCWTIYRLDPRTEADASKPDASQADDSHA